MAASTQLLTDAASAAAQTPNVTSKAAAIAAAGPITSIEGMTNQLKLQLQEAKATVTALLAVVDSGDTPLFTLLTDINSSLD